MTSERKGFCFTCVKDGPALDEEDDGQDAEEEQDPGGGEQVNAHACKRLTD